MLSRTAEYAIRAMLALAALDNGEARSASALGDELGVPRNYLAKTLNRLAKRGLLVSVRGPRGGFRLAYPASSISLAEVIREFDDLGLSDVCVMGDRRCDASNPCIAHERWKDWSESMARMVGDTTVADFMAGPAATPGGEAA